MKISHSSFWTTFVVFAVAAGVGACASNPPETQTTETNEHHSSNYQPPAPVPPPAPAPVAAPPAVSPQAQNDNGLDFNQTPIGKTEDQAAGSVGYQEQKQFVTTETVNHAMPAVKQTTLKADINRMSADDFVAMGVPKNVADGVIKSRDDHGGKFASVDDLKQVPGMSTAWVDQHRPQLALSSPS